MPGRYQIVGIVAFWLLATGWLFVRELWPRLRPGGPPPFTIDLADEASEPVIRWSVIMDGRDRGFARTQVKYRPADDSFELSSDFKIWGWKQRQLPPEIDVASTYRVTREGRLLEVEAIVRANVSVLGIPRVAIDGSVFGRVENGRLTPQAKANFGGLGPAVESIEGTLQPIDVPSHASVLNPFQPLNKMKGLAPGQRWHMPYFDPLEEIARQFLPGSGRDHIVAEVSAPAPLPDLPLDQGPGLPSFIPGGARCLHVRFHTDDLDACCWVREADGVLLRQEVTKDGKKTILNRDL